MLKYISSGGTYRKHYDFLEQYKLFSSSFYNVSMTMLRQEVTELLGQDPKKQGKHVCSLISIQTKKCKTSEIGVKTLWLVHLLFQILTPALLKAEQDQILCAINHVLTHARKPYLVAAKSAHRIGTQTFGTQGSSSADSEVRPESSPKISSIKNMAPILKAGEDGVLIEKQGPVRRRVHFETDSPKEGYKEGYIEEELDIRLSMESEAAKSQKQMQALRSTCGSVWGDWGECEIQKNVKTKEQFFNNCMIIPYGNFLMQLHIWKTSESAIAGKKGDYTLRECQAVINIFKSMLKATECFMQIVRYFKQPNLFMLVMCVEVFHADIVRIYSQLRCSLENMLEGISGKFDAIMGLRDRAERMERLEELIELEEIRTLKEYFVQISYINEKLNLLYENKYARPILRHRKLFAPAFIETETGLGELVYSIIEVYEKQIKSSIRSSCRLRNKHSFNIRSSACLSSEEENDLRSSTKSIGNNLAAFGRHRRPSVINEIEAEDSGCDSPAVKVTISPNNSMEMNSNEEVTIYVD